MTHYLSKFAGEVIAGHLDEIKKLYVDGVKITILIRNPGMNDADMVISNDTTEEAIAALRWLAKTAKKETMKVRKISVIVEAEIFDGTIDSLRRIWEMAPEYKTRISGGNDYLHIDTLEGKMTAQKGDWIIKGVAGECYPCKPDIFVQTYELV